ncbi:MAG: hypothetical protein ACI8XO_002591 [Verrucomicrobiales bacterium]|jgi:hypothetical protein
MWASLLRFVPAAVLLFHTAFACQVPVFRYALERWEASRYELIIESNGDLSPAEQEAVDFLVRSAGDQEERINLRVRVPEEAGATGESGAAKMSLHYPGRLDGFARQAIWSGAVNMVNAKRVIDSPVRQELVRRILKGESAIWVIVESGDSQKDKAAEDSLTKSLGEATDKLKIPDGVVGRNSEPVEGYVDRENVLRSDVPLQIEFSLLRIQRSDPEEQVFLQMLLNIESDLGEFAGEPMIFPVFGRGRFLEPLVGRGVTRDNVLEASIYLCGACSCEVKDQNPGKDLLMAMNWDAAIEGSQMIIDKVLPPLEGAAALIRGGVAAPSEATAPDGGLGWSRLLIIGAVVVLGLAAGTGLILFRKPS